MKRFKLFIIEEEQDASFISFIESVLTNNQIDANKANSFLIPQFNYRGIIYRVIFCPKVDITNLLNNDIPDTKRITDYIVKKFNINRYVFFSKSLKGIENLIKYPGLFKISEDQIGVIFSIKTNSSIDLTMYSGQNEKIKERLEQTEEVLSFEDLSINNIEALYYFNQGWKFDVDLNKSIFGNENEVEERFESPKHN